MYVTLTWVPVVFRSINHDLTKFTSTDYPCIYSAVILSVLIYRYTVSHSISYFSYILFCCLDHSLDSLASIIKYPDKSHKKPVGLLLVSSFQQIFQFWDDPTARCEIMGSQGASPQCLGSSLERHWFHQVYPEM